ncbi:putative efflux pump kojT [Fulvia fulva]|uniref:Efflux pump kojT n=1 Tax=Passalora fulva TaxID=5499 RepID=A0A9Q8UVJ4_PASFU|nr:putative efflux pump kojT [Fulvia fulva]KAK4611956.1 putative efflux pump kojT [Fulvia fulva]KAK4612829.1 putative efflux pump kojT [Fulvia fulva]UJO24023.1 putative efflux pump kojT [Fulvia fulva]WPV21082.1 putative efflux pump kojT [Fulvia fulva]WPV36186.1 putative efflux pump kojT [Fulvia fulva]
MQSFLQYCRLQNRVATRIEIETDPIAEGTKDEARLPEKDNVVASNGDDSTDPRNWSSFHRGRVFAIVWLLVFSQGWVSTCDSRVAKPESEGLHVSETAQTVTTAVFFIGIALGALFAGPLSETFGRNPVYLISTFVLLTFTLGSALAPSFGALVVLRFLSGVASSPTLSIYGGTLADLFTNEERRMLAPVAGGFIADRIDWRWTLWIGLAFVGAVWLLAVAFLPETFSPVLLQYKAKHLRALTGNDAFVAPTEQGDGLAKRLRTNISRPIAFCTSEPIVLLLGSYLILIFVINFSFLNGLDFIFTDTYGISTGVASLAFVSITVGVLIDISTTHLHTRLCRRVLRRNCRAFVKRKPADPSDESSSVDTEATIPPELSLIRAAIAAPFLPLSLFWLGWTNYSDINPASGYVATIFFGYALSAIFISSYQYIIDGYETYSSSALASITMARYVFSAGLVVATRPMYQGIGVQFVMTIMGTLALLLVPVPWLLMRYGDRVRARSKFAREVAESRRCSYCCRAFGN